MRSQISLLALLILSSNTALAQLNADRNSAPRNIPENKIEFLERTPRGQQQLREIDSLISTSLAMTQEISSENVDYDAAFTRLAKVRVKQCPLSAKFCFDPKLWSEKACSNYFLKPMRLADLVWETWASSITKESDAEKMWGAIQKCAPRPTLGQVSAALIMARNAEDKKWSKLQTTANDWLGRNIAPALETWMALRDQPRTEKMNRALLTLRAFNSAWDSHRPIPLDKMGGFIVGQCNWFKDQDLIGSSPTVIHPFALMCTRNFYQMARLTSTIAVVDKLLATAPATNIGLPYVGILLDYCTALRESGKAEDCLKLAEQIVSTNARSPLVIAKTQAEVQTGGVEEAAKNLPSYGIWSKRFAPPAWIAQNLELGYLELARGKVSAAQAALAAYKTAAQAEAKSPADLLGKLLEIRVLDRASKGAEALKVAEEARQIVRANYGGPNYDAIQINYDVLLIQLRAKNREGLAEASKALRAALTNDASQDYYRAIVDASDAKLAAQAGTEALAKVASTRGAKNPDAIEFAALLKDF